MKKLNWKKKYLSDKSGYWFEANVDTIQWKYTVESPYASEKYNCFLWIGRCDDEVKISKKQFKTVEDAQSFCENHFVEIVTKLNKIFKK